jgi:integrase
LGLKWKPSRKNGWFDLKSRMMHRRGSEVVETDKRTPTVRIPDNLMPYLERWHAIDFQRGWKWVCHYDGQPVKKLRRSWDTACRQAGLGDDVLPHTLRHTAVTWRLRAGEPPWQVAGFVGMSLAMLDRVYGHHTPK